MYNTIAGHMSEGVDAAQNHIIERGMTCTQAIPEDNLPGLSLTRKARERKTPSHWQRQRQHSLWMTPCESLLIFESDAIKQKRIDLVMFFALDQNISQSFPYLAADD